VFDPSSQTLIAISGLCRHVRPRQDQLHAGTTTVPALARASRSPANPRPRSAQDIVNASELTSNAVICI